MNGELPVKRRGLLRLGGYGLIAAVGYILSPASWWNDAFVNIPLALLSARVLTLIGIPFTAGFTASYWATNIAGILLMAYGGAGVADSRVTLGTLLKWLLASTAYTIAAVCVVGLFDL